MQVSTAQLSHTPFPFVSRCHEPVAALNVPVLLAPLPLQLPTTGKSSGWPKAVIQLSTPQPSHWPLPLRSKNHSPVLGRKTPIFVATEGVALKVAVQLVEEVRVIEPLVQPLPLQPVNVEPAAGVATRATTVPLLNDAEQVLPQLRPAGLLVTVPMPVPTLEIARVDSGADWGRKVAVQVAFAFRVIEPLVHPVPLQPAKIEPEAGVAVRVTSVPLLKVAEQVLPQLMPAGLLVTAPFPVPPVVICLVRFMVSVNCCPVGCVTVGVGVAPH